MVYVYKEKNIYIITDTYEEIYLTKENLIEIKKEIEKILKEEEADEIEEEEPDDIDSDFGFDPYMGEYTYDC